MKKVILGCLKMNLKISHKLRQPNIFVKEFKRHGCHKKEGTGIPFQTMRIHKETASLTPCSSLHCYNFDLHTIWSLVIRVDPKASLSTQ